MLPRHKIVSSSNSLRSKIQIEDLVDKSSNMLFPEQGMTTLSRHSAHYSERRRESRIQSIHSTQPTELSSNGKLQGKMECRLQYIGFSLISMVCAFTVMIIWYTVWSSKKKGPTDEVNGAVNDMINSNLSCQHWELAGDGYCDDEANVPDCGYDFNDCCETENDRSLCQNCTCYLSQNKTEKYKESNCQDWIDLLHLGDGNCDINYNTEEYFFDVGDCCLELDLSSEYGCRYKDMITGAIEDVYCPENTCIKSNNFCIPEELGDGICQDHNNGKYCDYDMGDCCDPSVVLDQCCICSCRGGSTMDYESWGAWGAAWGAHRNDVKIQQI